MRNAEKHRAAQRAWYEANRAKCLDKARAWKDANREKVNARSREIRAENKPKQAAQVRARKYGLSVDAQRAMLDAQGHACAVCRGAFRGPRDTHLDHDHETREVRGFLCGACNTAIGLMKDSPSRLRAAAAYIDRRQPKLRLA